MTFLYTYKVKKYFVLCAKTISTLSQKFDIIGQTKELDLDLLPCLLS